MSLRRAEMFPPRAIPDHNSQSSANIVMTEIPDPTPPPFSLPRVPEHRHSIWYYFGGLALFLLLLMVGSGLLLSMYYEPSASPATLPDGSPLGAARLTRDVAWSDRSYKAGELIALPLDSAGEVIPYGPLNGAVATLKDPVTGGAVRPSAAWVSVEGRIMREVEFGPLVRSVHVYAANLLIASAVIHMFSVFFMRAYRRRRGLWLTGCTLMLLLLGSAFTGYLLPWNQLAYVAAQIGVGMPEGSVPWIGPAIASILRGGANIGPATLTRVHAMHTVAIPLATLAFTATHILLVGYFGLAGAEGVRRRGGMMTAGILGAAALLALLLHPMITGGFDAGSAFVIVPLAALPAVAAYLLAALARSPMLAGAPPRPDAAEPAAAPEPPAYTSSFIYRDLLCWTIALGIIVTLAVAAPWSDAGSAAGAPVDPGKPLLTPRSIHPEWYFLFLSQLLGLLPGSIALLLLLIVGGFWVAVPYLDRPDGRRNPALVALGVTILLGLVLLTLRAYADIAAQMLRY